LGKVHKPQGIDGSVKSPAGFRQWLESRETQESRSQSGADVNGEIDLREGPPRGLIALPRGYQEDATVADNPRFTRFPVELPELAADPLDGRAPRIQKKVFGRENALGAVAATCWRCCTSRSKCSPPLACICRLASGTGGRDIRASFVFPLPPENLL
jgi:hypothetical protein